MSDMRADFEAAIGDSGLETEDENALQETEQEVLVDEIVEEEQSPVEEGEPADTDKPASEIPPDEAKDGGASPDTNIAAKDAESEKAATDSLKAPMDWGPKERESWSKIPRPLQDKIVAREKEMADAMKGTSEARRTHQTFNNLAQTYAPILAAEGASSPMEAVQNMFQTVAQLRMGSPADKAGQVANIIKQYGVDIATLDSLLVGEAPANTPDTQLEQMINQRMAPIDNMMAQFQQSNQQAAQATQQQATNDVIAFSQDHEFLADVRNDMADLIDLSAKHGRDMTMKEAYDKACALHPEISQVISDRARNESLLANKKSLSSKRTAASSLNGQMMGGGGSIEGQSLRDTLANAYDNAGS